ncbi:MAG: hypothetical protein N2039_15605 [Gemmataceae bacterium]|nr:hypothetical protein [Gemmataceae bacterium]
MNSQSAKFPDPDREVWISPFEDLLRSEPANPSLPAEPGQFPQPNPMFGTPDRDTVHWDGKQSYADTCAIRCQEFILEQFTRREIDEGMLVREAMEHGWYTPGAGTRIEDVGNLLELHGVPVNRYQNASVIHLTLELAQGHKVIVGVDSAELWHGNSVLEEIRDELGFKTANHAVVVSGIDTSDPNNIQVIISDPGTGDAVACYPLEQFVNAWRDSDFFMVATRDPAPPHLPEMSHFDYSIGHIPTIAGVHFEQFLTYADRPEQWEVVVHQFVEVHYHFHIQPPLDALPAAGPEYVPFQPVDIVDLVQDFATGVDDENDGTGPDDSGVDPSAGDPDPADWA